MSDLSLAVGIADAVIAATQDFSPVDVRAVACELALAHPDRTFSEVEIRTVLRCGVEEEVC